MANGMCLSQNVQYDSRLIIGKAKEFADGFWIEPHTHPRAQLLYATRGVMRVTAAGSTWVVPPARAVWIPAGIEHELRMVGEVAMRTLYIQSDAASWLRAQCTVVEVSRLLRELILKLLEEITDNASRYGEGCRSSLIEQLILLELRDASSISLCLPMPSDVQLSKICQFLLAHPTSTDTIEYLSEQVGLSARTLARRFRAETGLSFTEWRQQVRLAEAVCRLANGQSVKQIASELGYQSASAFIAMFRRALGQPPHTYSSSAVSA